MLFRTDRLPLPPSNPFNPFTPLKSTSPRTLPHPNISLSTLSLLVIPKLCPTERPSTSSKTTSTPHIGRAKFALNSSIHTSFTFAPTPARSTTRTTPSHNSPGTLPNTRALILSPLLSLSLLKYKHFSGGRPRRRYFTCTRISGRSMRKRTSATRAGRPSKPPSTMVCKRASCAMGVRRRQVSASATSGQAERT
ncbi:hypothetical protein HBH92_018260 [Parastagonospora nodorum]|nr:hypothetical protein HBH52_105760 [Parastagonospora nodorum]KAH4068615.1 hypothetical protein HBH50_116350 [Parastagonospora nodorum]KAH4100206.1 hypothetical protein HBH48_017890 [Parastagonospora nodorum]KAH4422713.1 hypothetical protein HBH92_018260 [Parastagonospora nodorum]KAH4425239.1 hypothetical protein HBH93_184170 [Parastagonospora nodorum]